MFLAATLDHGLVMFVFRGTVRPGGLVAQAGPAVFHNSSIDREDWILLGRARAIWPRFGPRGKPPQQHRSLIPHRPKRVIFERGHDTVTERNSQMIMLVKRPCGPFIDMRAVSVEMTKYLPAPDFNPQTLALYVYSQVSGPHHLTGREAHIPFLQHLSFSKVLR